MKTESTSLTKQNPLRAYKPSQAISSFEVAFSKVTSIEEAFEQLLIQCLQQLQENEDGISHVYHIESLHQFRIGLRRLRLTTILFKNLIVVPTELIAELKWLITSLGPARDCDVLLRETLPRLAKIVPQRIELGEIQTAAKDLAFKKHRIAASAIGSQRYTLFVLNFLLWVHTRGWRDALTPHQKKALKKNITAFCHDKIARRNHQLLKQSRLIEVGNITMLHRTRITAKYARYTTEFFSALLSPKKAPVGSTGQSNTGIKFTSWRFKSQGFSWSLI